LSRWIVLATIAAALVFAASLEGWTTRIITSDSTGIVWVVAVAFVLGFVSLLRGPAVADWMCDHGVTLMLGLLGTLVGFMAALTGAVDGDTAQKFSGVNSALVTTVAGLVAHMYLLLATRVLGR
jgi:hypothetical protein